MTTVGQIEKATQARVLALFQHRLPVEPVAQPFEQRPDRARPVIGQGGMAVLEEAEFLVLGSDPPVLTRLAAGFHVARQLVKAFDKATAALRDRH